MTRIFLLNHFQVMVKELLNRLPRKPSKSSENRDRGGTLTSSSTASTNSRSIDLAGYHNGNSAASPSPSPLRGLNHGDEFLHPVNSEINGSSETSSYEALPSFKDVANSEKQNLFISKVHMCCAVFDFTDSTKNLKEKEVKRKTLVELVDYLSSANGKFTDVMMQEIVKMVSINLFRTLTPLRGNNVREASDTEVEQPLMDPAWPHLQLVYEFLLRFVVSPETDAMSAKKYVDRSFVLKLLDLFDSEDRREREYSKTVLHRIYGKFMVHRSFIRKAINNVFCEFIYETEKHNGIAELLEIWGSIISGFALPLKEEHKKFLARVLIPLHKPKCVPMYHQQLSYCIMQFLEKDCEVAGTVIRGLLKYWPIRNCTKEVMFLGELQEVLAETQPAELQRCMESLFRQISRCLSSSNFQVAESAFELWRSDHIQNLIKQNRRTILPIVLPALENNARNHWYKTVRSLTSNVSIMFSNTDPELYQECLCKFQKDEEQEEANKLEREAAWTRVEEIAAMN